MPSFNRADEYARAENGPDWFNNFLNELSKINTASDSKKETVESLTQQYRQDIGLDLILSQNVGESIVATASTTKRTLSKRAENKEDIKKMPKVQEAIDSFCRNSGGTKSAHSILHYLRELLGKENVSYTDNELLDYINEIKNHYKQPESETFFDVGRAGTEKGEFTDTKADYFTHSKM